MMIIYDDLACRYFKTDLNTLIEQANIASKTGMDIYEFYRTINFPVYRKLHYNDLIVREVEIHTTGEIVDGEDCLWMHITIEQVDWMY